VCERGNDDVTRAISRPIGRGSSRADLYNDLDYFGSRIVLRPQEISNNPTIIRQLGVIAINTALEVDIYGHVNSSHVCGTQMMNGIGGSGDFERNARLSVFVCPSIAKGGGESPRSFPSAATWTTASIQCISWPRNKEWPIYAA